MAKNNIISLSTSALVFLDTLVYVEKESDSCLLWVFHNSSSNLQKYLKQKLQLLCDKTTFKAIEKRFVRYSCEQIICKVSKLWPLTVFAHMAPSGQTRALSGARWSPCYITTCRGVGLPGEDVGNGECGNFGDCVGFVWYRGETLPGLDKFTWVVIGAKRAPSPGPDVWGPDRHRGHTIALPAVSRINKTHTGKHTI